MHRVLPARPGFRLWNNSTPARVERERFPQCASHSWEDISCDFTRAFGPPHSPWQLPDRRCQQPRRSLAKATGLQAMAFNVPLCSFS